MNKKNFLVAAAIAATHAGFADFKKPDEPQNVPELMKTAAGEAVTTREQWEKIRRPELLQTFLEKEYGVRPVERPEDLKFEQLGADEEVYGGKAVKKVVRGTYSGPGGAASFMFAAWIPKSGKPVPASARLASPAWELYGKAGLVGQGFPKPDQPLHAGNVGYHLRSGLHDITRYDWECYIDFADGHGWRVGGNR